MSTRSGIGIEHDDRRITGIYCHFNGGLAGVGRILLAHYADRSKLQQLVSGGDISSLGAEIGEKHDFDRPPDGVTNYYSRDGDQDVDCRQFSGREQFVRHFCQIGVEFAYLLDRQEQWLVARLQSSGSRMSRWKSLT